MTQTVEEDDEKVWRERAAQLAARRRSVIADEAESDTAVQGEPLLLLAVGAEQFALPLARIARVLPAADYPPTPVPGAPTTLRGLINADGRPLPLFDTAALLFGVPAVAPSSREEREENGTMGDEGHVILLRGEASGTEGVLSLIGLYADRAEGVASTTDLLATAGTSAAESRFVAAVLLPRRDVSEDSTAATTTRRPVSLIDIDPLLAYLSRGTHHEEGEVLE